MNDTHSKNMGLKVKTEKEMIWYNMELKILNRICAPGIFMSIHA